jgi:hypothetical protein
MGDHFQQRDDFRPGDGLTTPFSRLTIRSIMKDKERMESLVRASGSDWTLERPAVLVDGTLTTDYVTGADLRLGFRSRISYADDPRERRHHRSARAILNAGSGGRSGRWHRPAERRSR